MANRLICEAVAWGLLALVSAGCRDAVPGPSGAVSPGEDAIEVRIPYCAPETETRSISPTALDVSSSRLFVFGEDAKFLYEAPIRRLHPDPEHPERGTLTAFLREGTRVRLALYANLSPAMRAKELSPGISLDEAAREFAFADLSETLPMYGVQSDVTISRALAEGEDAVQTLGGTMPLLRSVACIRVQPAPAGYTLRKAWLYNMSDAGLVAPQSSLLDSSSRRVTGPSLPSPYASETEPQEIVASEGVLPPIYVPECDNLPYDGEQSAAGMTPEEANLHSKRPCLVLEMEKEGESSAHCYRVDFVRYSEHVSDPATGIEEQTDARVKYAYLPLLRNCRYTVSVTKLAGPGFASRDEALRGSSANIAYDVWALSESGLGEVTYDGRYTLSVSETELSAGGYGKSFALRVCTTCPGGWRLEVPEGIDWIRCINSEGAEGQPATVTVTVDPNRTYQPRTALLRVRAGRMERLITVRQSVEAELSISLWADPEGTVPLSCLEICPKGIAAPSPEAAGGYRRFYIRTDHLQGFEGQRLVPSVRSVGGDRDFFFYDFGSISAAPVTEATLVDGWKQPKWFRPNPARGLHLCRVAGPANLWECIITARPMPEGKGVPDLYSGRYVITLEDGGVAATATLVVLQSR